MTDDAPGPTVGDPAPGFSLPRDGGGTLALADLAGRHVVLYFYPKDDTPGCTAEALAFTALADAFKRAGAVVLGVSRDPVARHDRFRDRHGLSVTLLSDEDGAVCGAYGTWVEKRMYGRTHMGVDRATFLVGPDGRIARIWRRVKVPGHAEAVLAALAG